MIFELTLLLYLLVTWYVYNNFPDLIKNNSNLLPIIALICVYVVSALLF
jgi:hypothetical protein